MRSPSAGPPPARVGATSATAVRAHETGNHKPAVELEDSGASAIWTWTARIMTCCFLPPCLRACGQRDKAVQQAWREKVALCMIIVVLCGAVAFLTVGLRRVLCPDSGFQVNIAMFNIQTKEYLPANQDGIVIDGFQYEFGGVQKALSARGFTLNDDRRGTDLSLLFSNVRGSDCAAYYPAGAKCDFPELAGISPASDCASLDWLSGVQRAKRFMDWTDLPIHIDPPHTLTVYNGAVLNLTDYFAGPQRDNRPAVTKLLVESVGKDATYRYVRGPEVHSAIGCLSRGYRVGYVGEERNGCIAAQVIETIALIVIVGVVLCKFFMAVWFHWFGLPSSKVDPVPRPDKRLSRVSARYSMGPNVNNRHSVLGFNMPQTNDLYTIMLVTCYSEGKEGIRSTLDSLAGTDYPDSKKLLFVVADGIITGSGEERSTPDIIVGMMDLEPSAANPEPKSYVAIAHGEKQHNMAKVYAGHYIVGNRRVPMITVVKCGTPMEANQPKPGNRGKRDSQLVIMNFLSRTLFNDRMTALDYEIFSCIHSVATTADKYEAILMVDADTKVAPDSLRHMVNAMRSDVTIMGLCGETRIANKTASLTSAIQVFEYYISHHLGKAFESVFGGVTCLPGCFCMYRIKAPKGDSGTTVPILTNPNIVEEYSENIVDTLHKKNLLLLGEDRFLTTLMLRNFPHRKMVFVPSAMCWTIVPDEFKVLLSQRRRWINSTVHNLLELVLVRDLCGTFCFSMQFVVLLELIGTVVLPAAICLTLYLIISAAAYGTAELVPFLMLAAILGLPGLLIAITTRKVVYVAWMIVYLFSLPIWNFVLPVYAYWHFDDFSWGETRKVEGEEREEAHGGKQGRFESRAVVMKK
ncbi:chitin synthase [Powellomyces hirtus]|nr:chitin synthase [Powellomyces hirtus]